MKKILFEYPIIDDIDDINDSKEINFLNCINNILVNNLDINTFLDVKLSFYYNIFFAYFLLIFFESL